MEEPARGRGRRKRELGTALQMVGTVGERREKRLEAKGKRFDTVALIENKHGDVASYIPVDLPSPLG
jgi:hypothetical protein